MPAQGELSREDKHRLFELLEVLKLDDSRLRHGIEQLAKKTRAGMTKEDVAWVESEVNRDVS